MSKIQDLIDLKLVATTGEVIYDDELGTNDINLLKQEVEVIKRIDHDSDPELSDYSYTPGVVVKSGNTLFKSNAILDSYDRETWTDWKEVKAESVILYYYDEFTY